MNSITNADELVHPRLTSRRHPPLTCTFSSPIGVIGLRIEDEQLVTIDMLSEHNKLIASHDTLSQEIIRQITAYFRNPHFQFTIPYKINSTPFQQRFYHELQSIPSGTVTTYSELATTLQSAPRAIGQACRRNPLPIIIPCHRVIAKNHLGGYSGAKDGAFMNIKKWLLRHEGFLAQ